MPELPDPTEIKVYTAIVGSRDPQRTDIECFDYYPWLTLPVLQAKIFKVLYYGFMDEEFSIWVDGNIFLRVDPVEIIKLFLGTGADAADIGVWKHFGRDCIMDEAEAINTVYGSKIGNMALRQARHYRYQGHPEHYGLAECNVIVRKDSPKVRTFCNHWWSEICIWGFRDQISFPYVARLHPEVKVNYVEGNPRNHEYFEFKNHTGKLLSPVAGEVSDLQEDNLLTTATH